MPFSAKNAPAPVSVFAEPLGIRNTNTDTTYTTSQNAYAELVARGLVMTVTATGGLSVRPARLVDAESRQLIQAHRSGLIAIVGATEPDPIRRGLLTGNLAGYHLERNADGETVEAVGLADWHASVLGVTQ